MKIVLFKSDINRVESPDKIFSLHEAENLKSKFLKYLSQVCHLLSAVWVRDIRNNYLQCPQIFGEKLTKFNKHLNIRSQCKAFITTTVFCLSRSLPARQRHLARRSRNDVNIWMSPLALLTSLQQTIFSS